MNTRIPTAVMRRGAAMANRAILGSIGASSQVAVPRGRAPYAR
jgi:hypothetical protein